MSGAMISTPASLAVLPYPAIDPVIFQIGPFAVRWYALGYIFGLLGGWWYAVRIVMHGRLWGDTEKGPLQRTDIDDFAFYAMIGILLGGRIGYILFYHLPKVGWAGLVKDPLLVFRVWEGGMASHGGILGLVIFTWFYARKEKVSWTGLGDGLCVVAPLGLFFGRAANFVNGELYGRVAEGVSWAMKFPLSIGEESQEVQGAAWQACIQVDPKLADAQSLDALITASRENPAVRNTLAEFLQPRHPSQIYEGLLEGALLFTILWVVRVRFKNAPHGLLTGLFFALYALFRIFGEQFREPDAAMVGFLTKGQFFSLFMFIFAACFLTYAWRGRKKAVG